MSREEIERTKMSNGFNGNETERDLLFYVISKLDDLNDKNSVQHLQLSEAIGVSNRDIAKNCQHVKYIKLGIYGITATVLYILNIIFRVV